MLISQIIIIVVFIVVMILIILDIVNKAVIAILGAVITYALLIFIEHVEYPIIVELLFGNAADNYVGLRSIILILGMMVIVEIGQQAGVFQFLSFRLIQMTKGQPRKLLITLCTLAVFLTAVLNNILAIIVLIPLTFTVSRILKVNPVPYVLSETYFVTIGGTIFSISSIPSILISFYAQLSFWEFFANIGIISVVVYFLTLILFLIVMSNQLQEPNEGIEILLEYNVWSFVEDRRLMLKALITLVAVIVGLITIPSTILSPEIITLIAAMVLIVISKIDAKNIFGKIDLELLLFLLGVSVIVGAMSVVGIIDTLGNWLLGLTNGNLYVSVILVLWISAVLSAAVDDISITKLMIPIVDVMTKGIPLADKRITYYSLTWGINFGDNMTPFGDTIMVFNIAEEYNYKITYRSYFKYGLMTSFFNLGLITIYISFIFYPVIGTILLCILIGFILLGLYPRIKKLFKQKLNKPPQEIPINVPIKDIEVQKQLEQPQTVQITEIHTEISDTKALVEEIPVQTKSGLEAEQKQGEHDKPLHLSEVLTVIQDAEKFLKNPDDIEKILTENAQYEKNESSSDANSDLVMDAQKFLKNPEDIDKILTEDKEEEDNAEKRRRASDSDGNENSSDEK